MIFVMRKKRWRIILLAIVLYLFYMLGVLDHAFEKDFYREFQYPYDGDIEVLVEKLKNNQIPDVKPINIYNFEYQKNPKQKCDGIRNLRLVYLVKSSPENLERRSAIRSTWGYEKRFSDVEIRTVFLVGEWQSTELDKAINTESRKFSDIIQANFTDTYYNNTYKTMMAQQWAVKYCPQARYYMFVDDDYYVSTKNVLRFIRHPTNYPRYVKDPMINVKEMLLRKPQQEFDLSDDVRLYTGYVFISAPHRHFFSRWYVSLKEYPYHLWPPYVTAGAYILSKSALIDIYYTSFYTKHFRFDDIFVGLLAYKAKIEPFHCDEFYFYRKPYQRFSFNYTIASHGFDNTNELKHVWTEQRSLGNA